MPSKQRMPRIRNNNLCYALKRWVLEGGIKVWLRLDRETTVDSRTDAIIASVDRVIVIGSPALKERYDQRSLNSENSSSIVREINAIRLRDLKREEGSGIISVYFTDDCALQEECISHSLRHIKALPFDKKDYFYSFMSILKDIYQAPDLMHLMERYFDQYPRRYHPNY